jgi:hypothetical protein
LDKKILINAGWIAVAGATFAIGRMTVKPGGETGGEPEILDRQGGLTSIIATDPGARPQANAAAAEDDFLSKYLTGEAQLLSKEGMAAAMREAMAETDPIKRSLMIAQLMQNLTADNVQDALAALRETSDRRENFQYFALLQYAWGKIDGEAAIAAAVEEGGRGGAFGAMSVISGWASTDPEAAKQWIESQEDGREKMMYMNGLIEGLAKSDPAAATAYVLAMEAPAEGEGGRGGFDMRSRYISNIAGEMLKQGVEAASAWANDLPAGSMRSSALNEVAQYYARQDPATAAKWIEAYADSADAGGAIREIADRWARESPAEAARWVAELPEASQADAMRSVFDDWAQKEPVEASEFLAQLQPSSGRDSAVSGFSRELAGEDPGAAIAWASSIADEALRQSTEMSVARRWYRDEPEAAQEWAQQNLPAESQEAITERDRGGDRGDGGGGFDMRGGGGRGRGR